jgi:hypothetical protein
MLYKNKVCGFLLQVLIVLPIILKKKKKKKKHNVSSFSPPLVL